jgi:hypothetical protein
MNEESLPKFCYSIKRPNIEVIGVIHEGLENDKGIENLFKEIKIETFLNLGKDTNI